MITAATSKYVSASRPRDEDDDRPAPRGQRPDRDERVHRRRAVTRVRNAARWNGQPPQSTTGVGERERDPLPAVELERRHHREQRERQRSARTRRRGGAAAHRPACVRGALASRCGAVARGPTAATSSSTVTRSGRTDRRRSMAKLTVASTPSSLFSLRSMREAQDAQVMPSRSRRTRSVGTTSGSVAVMRRLPRFLDCGPDRHVLE